MTDFKDKKIAFLGLAVDNKDCLPWLEKHGAEITILDEAKGDKFENLDQYDLIVRSPGVYRFRPELLKTKVEITSKTKLFFDLVSGLPAGRQAKIIGVTGTKGKGTTATLIYEMLKAAGKKVFLGGNIGSGVFGILGKLGKEDWVVLELSSFQLIDLHRSPHIAVVLMTTSDHLDWHSSVGEYLDAKKNIVAHQMSSDFCVVNKDYPNSMKITGETRGKIIEVSGKEICLETKLLGVHNRENIAASVAVAKIVGVSEEIIEKVVRKFRGLEHRLEEVATINGITFYNDSYSTTPETAMAAIKSFSQPLILILGGSSKGSDFGQLGETIVKSKNIKAVITIGVEGGRINESLKDLKEPKLFKGPNTMEKIVKMAYNQATSGDVVLLSPACASFDMFKSYMDRGKQFKSQVRELEI